MTFSMEVKNSKRYTSTGGLGLGGFDGTKLKDQIDRAAKNACFECPRR